MESYSCEKCKAVNLTTLDDESLIAMARKGIAATHLLMGRLVPPEPSQVEVSSPPGGSPQVSTEGEG